MYHKSLSTISESLAMDINSVQGKFDQAGIKASHDETLKTLAARYELDPIDRVKIILIEGFKPIMTVGGDGG